MKESIVRIDPETANLSRADKISKWVRVAGILIILAILTMSTVCASDASNAIQRGVKDGAKQVYDIMTAVIIPIGAIAFAWCGFSALFGGERGMEIAKKRILTVVIVLGLVYLAPVAIEQVGGWFKSMGTGSVFS